MFSRSRARTQKKKCLTPRAGGDHGPINSWDRQAYWTDVRYGSAKPSWTPAPNVIRENVIIANYGGSQGVDNDDGSAWFDIHHNFIFGEGLKNDYGGHDSLYHENLNLVHPYDGQQCINVWAFKASGNAPCADGTEQGRCSHQHRFYQNKCALLTAVEDGYGTQQQVTCENADGTFNAQAKDQMAYLANNSYYSLNGTVCFLILIIIIRGVCALFLPFICTKNERARARARGITCPRVGTIAGLN